MGGSELIGWRRPTEAVIVPEVDAAWPDPAPPQGFSVAAAQVLEHLATSVGLDTWLVVRHEADEWVVLSSLGGELDGVRNRWADTLCAHVHDGHAERVTPDIDAVPGMARVRDHLGAEVRSFVSVPLPGDDGEDLGTLCGVGRLPSGPGLAACQPQVEVLAAVLGALLSAELRLEREARHRLSAEDDAHTDALTGLGNRRRWDEQLAAEEERCRRYGSSAAVVTVDVDGLKTVNDRWGHEAGDTLLTQVAQVLRRTCRPQDVVARLGGDEFAVLLAETTPAQAAAAAERVAAALADGRLPASVGSAMRSGEGLAGAWREADARMYDAKRGRSRQAPEEPILGLPVLDPVRSDVVGELLALVRRHVSADIAFVGRFEGGVRVMRAVEGGDPFGVARGHTEDLDTTYCQRILDGRLPSAIPDSRLHPAAVALPVTALLPIGAYIGVPVTLPDGQLYGSLCALSHEPAARFDATAVAFLESVARSLTAVLGNEEGDRAGRRRILSDIDQLLAGDGVTMAYQPVVDLRAGQAVAVEALARFEAPGRTTSEWFADAARVDRTSEVELRTASVALREAGSWPGQIWVNLSASVLVSPAVRVLLAGLDVSRVVVEVSEHEQVSDYEALRTALAPWRSKGMRFAVDDAGAGFSSLRHVLEMAPDFIKLDISLVHGLTRDPTRQALVTALVAFAREVGAQVVAEGVETAEEVEVLLRSGVQLGQGFHLGLPLPAREHARRLQLASAPRQPVPAVVRSVS